MRYRETIKAVNRVIYEYSLRLTVRQIYYRLISPPYQLFANTATNYKNFDKILTRARERVDVDWRKIEDRARSIQGGERGMFDSPDEYVDWLFDELNERYFIRSMWKNQPNYVEVWVEKDALSSLFQAALKEFRVVLFPSRGYSSFTKVMEALERLPDGKSVKILHFGDHDPSGLDMTRDLNSRLQSYSPDKFERLVVKRVALDIEQVRALDLPANPTKKADSRARDYIATYGDACWELDAIPPHTLTQWVTNAVEKEVDLGAWLDTQQEVQKERERIRLALNQSKEAIQRAKGQIKEALASAYSHGEL